GMLAIATRDGVKSPVEVSAEILATLRFRAEDSFADDLFGAVITVPAYFDDAQRQATKDAAELAGLKVLRLINEPTAAAIAYGLDNASEGLYAVYDLGGGTFDISLLRLTRGVFEVVATGGDAALGGDDFDRVLADWALAGRTVESAHDKRAVLVAARAAKEALSDADSTELVAPLDAGELRATVTRAQFEELAQPLIAKTLSSVKRVLRDAKVKAADVAGTVMVGGSTRMPVVRSAVSELFGREVLTNLNPDEVVALGAAIQANQLAGNAADGEILLLDVIPLSLGLETMGGLVERVIERNSTIPVAKAQDFTTFKDGQTVSAEELTSGVQAAITVKPSYGLSDDQIAGMLKDGFSSADADMAARKLREAKVEAERMVLATRSALAADGDLLTEAERQTLEARLVALAAMDGDADTIDAAVKALAEATEGFAAERMNRSIARALTGRNVSAL
ncbi:MAG: Hsp70 family protein, partial [Burkholderiales bacterium]|nr:Hsp70 family protein [Burkholderiales bacterium]